MQDLVADPDRLNDIVDNSGAEFEVLLVCCCLIIFNLYACHSEA
jgi:hypothetical protein